MKPKILCVVAASLMWAACGEEASETPDPLAGVEDVRVPIPEADPAFIDLITPEVEIPAGEEKMYCLHLEYDGPDVAVALMDSMQGKFGHHVVLLSTKDPQPAGTLEDCTEASEMWKYRSFILPDSEIPEGHAISLEKGMKYVLQFHYVNASTKPILVRDVARLETLPLEDVTDWTTTFTTNSLKLDVQAGETAEVTFDCVIEEDVELLLVGGHLHEWGQTMEFMVGPDEENLESLYVVDPWRPAYRDAPPVTLFFDAPRLMTAGTILRTHCTWDNDTDSELLFPAEMCSAFGYIVGTKTPVHCEDE